MIQALTNEQIFKTAPSVFATEPWSKVSERYAFIPTINIVEALRDEGFVPVRASQSTSRIEGKSEFTKHMLRFRRESDINAFPSVVNGNAHHFYKNDAPEVPELVLVNSHDRSSGYQLSAGIFRLVCSNGLVVKSSNFGDISVRHSGNIRDEVIEGSFKIIEQMPIALEAMQVMKTIELNPEERFAFASSAVQLRYPADEAGNPTSPIEPRRLLVPRRSDDNKNDLWTTFNTVQENFMKGGLRGVGKTGKRTTTRKIGSVNEDLRMNKALWMLTEQMAKIKLQ